MEQYLSVATLAKALDCSERKLRGMIKDHKLAAVRFGRQVRIPASALQDLLTRVEK